MVNSVAFLNKHPLPMYKPSTSSVVGHFPTYQPIHRTYFLHNGLTKVKPHINLVEVPPHLSHNVHRVDGVLMGAGSLWPPMFQKA